MQGSVEVTNGSVKQILASMVFHKRSLAKEEAEKRKITWVTEVLTAMRAIIQMYSKGTGQFDPYRIIFTMNYHDPLFADIVNDDGHMEEPTTVESRMDLVDEAFKERMIALGEYGNGKDCLMEDIKRDQLPMVYCAPINLDRLDQKNEKMLGTIDLVE